MNSYENEGRVLLLDDERLVRFTISAWLKASNFEVTAVETPEEAFVELKKRPYDVILSDVLMGVVDGFMFRDTVRGFNEKIPIVFLSALLSTSENQLMERIAQDIYSHYVPKNARREFLLGRLRQAVCAYRAEREATDLRARIVKSLTIAARVQDALLPPAVRCDGGLFYSGLWRPLDIVSGDLFCWFPLSEESAVVVFGDIAGHGAPAALSMTAVMAHLKELETSEGIASGRPELVCQELDSYIRNNLHDVTYMAGTVLFADFKSRVVRYLNAGGIEPLCLRKQDGTRIDLNPEKRGGLPMGMMDGTAYTQDDVVEAEIPEDALFFMYSDGFVDQTSDSQGENRMPHEVFWEILGELVRGADGTSDIISIPYRLSQAMEDMGYSHAHDDRSFFLFGSPSADDGRFVSTVSMKSSSKVDEAVVRAAKWAADRGYPTGVVAGLKILLREHLEYVRTQGLDDDGRRRELVVLEIRPAGDEIEILSWDRGLPYDEDLSERASLAIIRKISRWISHERFNGLNKFTFVMRAKP